MRSETSRPGSGSGGSCIPIGTKGRLKWGLPRRRRRHDGEAASGAELPLADSAPATANGVVYVGAGDGRLYAFDLKTGKRLWSVYVGSHDGNSVAFRRAG